MITSEQEDQIWVDSSQSHLQPSTYLPGAREGGILIVELILI